jgi:hypothetical protein
MTTAQTGDLFSIPEHNHVSRREGSSTSGTGIARTPFLHGVLPIFRTPRSHGAGTRLPPRTSLGDDIEQPPAVATNKGRRRAVHPRVRASGNLRAIPARATGEIKQCSH